MHLLQVKRNPARDPVEHGQLFRFDGREKILCLKNRERLQFNLGRPASKERTLVSKHLLFHKTHRRTTEDQLDVHLLPDMIDLDLEQR